MVCTEFDRTHIQDMLKSTRELVEQKQRRRGRRRLYAPRIKWASWLLTGGDQDEAMPVSGRKANRRDASNAADIATTESDASDSRDDVTNAPKEVDEEKAMQSHGRREEEQSAPPAGPVKRPVEGLRSPPKEPTLALQCRRRLADALEWVQDSDDFLYASKLTVAVILVSWPAWIPSWNLWYSLNRGCKFPSNLANYSKRIPR